MVLAVQGREPTFRALTNTITGSINHASVLGQHLVILNSFEVAHELLDLRGGIYSSRPRLVTFSEMCVEFSMPITRLSSTLIKFMV